MAEIKNRQVLINLHSSANTATADMLNLGEIAIKHNNVTGATIFTKTSDGKVAEFITKVAVEGLVNAVSSGLTTHINNYNAKMAELDAADEGHSKSIEDAEKRIKSLEDTMGGADGADGNVLTRLAAVEAKATVNETAISNEVTNRENAITAVTSAYKAADSLLQAGIDGLQSDKVDKSVYNAKVAELESAISAETSAREKAITAVTSAYEAADAALLGVSGDAATKATIYGAKAQAAAAQAAADAAQEAADAAQEDATYARNWVEAFKNAENVGEGVVDTLREIQDYITSDLAAANTMTQKISSAQTTADNALAAANAAQAAADAAQEAADAAQGDATSALNKIAAASGVTTSTGGAKVTVKTTESEGKVTGIEVIESDIASASAFTDHVGAYNAHVASFDALADAVVKSGEITNTGDGTITGTVASNKLTFDFSNLVIDCGTF